MDDTDNSAVIILLICVGYLAIFKVFADIIEWFGCQIIIAP